MATATTTRTVNGVTVPAAGTYTIDPAHSSVEAVARHMVVSKVRAAFRTFSGTIQIAEDPAQSRVDVEIDAASIDTREDKRDEHLRSADFLDVETYPKLTFASTHVSKVTNADSDRWTVVGDLTIHGQTRPVTLELTYGGTIPDPWGTPKSLFSATAKIDRDEFGITWNQALETGGVLVSKVLNIELEIQAAPAG